MLIRNKFSIILILIISCFVFISNLHADELDISASEIVFDKDKNLFIAKGSVTILDAYGNQIYTDRAEYESSKEFIKTYQNSELETYMFTQNYFSDLGRTMTMDNTQNFYSAFVFNLSLTMIGLLMSLFYFKNLIVLIRNC